MVGKILIHMFHKRHNMTRKIFTGKWLDINYAHRPKGLLVSWN
jgi:hypothetical protein